MQPYTVTFLNAQAQRTAPTRQFFYQHVKQHEAPVCIDIGCGSGAITPEFTKAISDATAIGFDIDTFLISQAVENNPSNQSLHYLLADAMHLPFRESTVSFFFSHFTMMWLSDSIQALNEIHNILCPKGVFASIEPDYAGRIEIRREQITPSSDEVYPIIQALQNLGANPFMGSQLPAKLESLGFQEIRSGILSWHFDPDATKAEIHDETTFLKEQGIQWVKPELIYTPIWWIIATTGKD